MIKLNWKTKKNALPVSMPNQSFICALIAEDANGEVVLRGGEAVMVMGASHRRGHLLVEHKNHHFHVPYQFLELKSNSQSGVDIWILHRQAVERENCVRPSRQHEKVVWIADVYRRLLGDTSTHTHTHIYIIFFSIYCPRDTRIHTKEPYICYTWLFRPCRLQFV